MRLVYAALLTMHDGLLSLILQPLMGAVFTTVVLAAALLLGLPLRIRAVGRLWNASVLPACLLLAGSLLVMCAGPFLGWTVTIPGSEADPSVTVLRPEFWLGSYLTLLFAIAHWPLPRLSGLPRADAGC